MALRKPLGALLVYGLLTAILGRHVLAQLGLSIANDPGDPLLTAAILHWNAHHIPWSDAWWQFPIYYPTRDTLAFSEHLLGLSVIATPIEWLTGNPVASYNLTMLLTFPLCGIAMYALVYRLTRSAGGAFVAGLAYAFAPYRISNLPHIQMLAAFWAPLSLLGLHEFVRLEPDSTNKLQDRLKWLVLFGAAWALQAAANGYTLVFFSVLVALWVLWFVVIPRRWNDLMWIGLATVVAALPLAPILYKYVTVHAYHGFERSLGEMRTYSADIAAVLCAPTPLSFWGWIRVACRAEGELFPGVAAFVLFAAAAGAALASRRVSRPARVVRGVFMAIAAVYVLIIAAVLLSGGLSVDLGVVKITASSTDKPLLVALAASILAVMITLAGYASRMKPAATPFYILAAITTWLLALGPTLTVMGELSGRPGPFVLLQWLPGATGLRVPARFWLMTVLCIAVVIGMFVAELARNRSARGVWITALVAAGLVADGWMGGIPAQPLPLDVPDASSLRGHVVLELPMDPYPDMAATWHAVTGGWESINGYSGFAPNYYAALSRAAHSADRDMFLPLRRGHDLDVIVRDDVPALQMVMQQQPGVVRVGRAFGATHYLLARQADGDHVSHSPIRTLAARSACNAQNIAKAMDGNSRTAWDCPSKTRRELTLDLGAVEQVGGITYGLGRYGYSVPDRLRVSTSADGEQWEDAPTRSVLAALIEGGLRDAGDLRADLPFAPRAARYVRVRAESDAVEFTWFVAELEVVR